MYGKYKNQTKFVTTMSMIDVKVTKTHISGSWDHVFVDLGQSIELVFLGDQEKDALSTQKLSMKSWEKVWQDFWIIACISLHQPFLLNLYPHISMTKNDYGISKTILQEMLNNQNEGV